MRTSKTFSIRFWVDAKKAKNSQALVYLRLTVNQKRLSLSLKRGVPLDIWDAKIQRLRGNSNEARQVNHYLEEVRSQLFQTYQDLKFKGELITAQKIKASYFGEDESSWTLVELIEYHSNKIENTHASGSIRNFAVT